MNEILLDEKQSSVVAQSHESVAVRDPAGTMLGHIVLNGKLDGPADVELWIGRLEEWYFEIDDQKQDQPETD